MSSYLVPLLGAGLIAFWGLMHLAFTRPALAGFEPLSEDNRHVLRMEWITEGLALVFIAALVSISTFLQGPGSTESSFIYWMSAAMLLLMAVVSLFTGARATPLPFKLCPPIFGTAALLFLLATL